MINLILKLTNNDKHKNLINKYLNTQTNSFNYQIKDSFMGLLSIIKALQL